MIQNYVRFLALVSCLPLIAHDPTQVGPSVDDIVSRYENNSTSKASFASDEGEITLPIRGKIAERVLYKQYPASRTKRPGASGYEAIKNSFTLLKDEAAIIDAADTIISLQEDVSAFWADENAQWPTLVVAARQKSLVSDYLKEVLLFNVQGVKKMAIPAEFSRLFSDGKVPLFENEPDAKRLNALISLIPDAVEKLALLEVTNVSPIEHVYKVSKATLIEALKNQAAAKSKSGSDSVHAAFTDAETIASYMPDLEDIAFTLKCGKNENAITAMDPVTGNAKEYKKVYNSQPADHTSLSDLLLPTDKPTSTMPTTPGATVPTSDVSNDVNGDWLSSTDMNVIFNSLNDDELRNAVRFCLDSNKKASLYAEAALEILCNRVVEELTTNPAKDFAVTPIKCEGGHWIACVLSKKSGELSLVVADSDNKDRRNEPAILKLAAAIKESMRKKEKDPVKIKDQATANPTADTAKSETKEDDYTYEAPLSRYKLDELPSLDQLFGGKAPNDIRALILYLQEVANQDMSIRSRPAAGTGMKNGIILYGPPGTGKSTIAQIMARSAKDKDGNEAWGVVFKIAVFRNAFQGSSEELLRKMFKKALDYIALHKKPCVIILDEIDGTTSKLEPHNSTKKITVP